MIGAKEMFEALGYKKYEDSEHITYKKEEGFGFFTLINFDNNQKQLFVSCSNLAIREEYHKARPISFELLKAINEQVDELGWTGDCFQGNLDDYVGAVGEMDIGNTTLTGKEGGIRTMNKNILEIELEQVFKIKGQVGTYKMTEDGLKMRDYITGEWGKASCYDFQNLLLGKSEIDIPILTDKEKAYLREIVKPFDVYKVVKTTYREGVYEQLELWVSGLMDGLETITLPVFKVDTLYKGLRVGERYSLEELGL